MRWEMQIFGIFRVSWRTFENNEDKASALAYKLWKYIEWKENFMEKKIFSLVNFW